MGTQRQKAMTMVGLVCIQWPQEEIILEFLFIPNNKKFTHHLSQLGQSTVEFALTMLFLFAFTLFFIQLSLVLSFGNFVHYATFMSARALLSAGSNESDQYDRAKAVIIRTLKKSVGEPGIDKFPSIAKANGQGVLPGFQAGPAKEFQQDDINYSWMQGVRYTFRSKIFLVPLGKPKNNTAPALRKLPANTLELTAESWLGMEVTEFDCSGPQQMGGGGGRGRGWRTDNGC